MGRLEFQLVFSSQNHLISADFNSKKYFSHFLQVSLLMKGYCETLSLAAHKDPGCFWNSNLWNICQI